MGGGVTKVGLGVGLGVRAVGLGGEGDWVGW